MTYQKGDLILANTTTIKGWAVYVVDSNDGYHVTVRPEDGQAGHPPVKFARSLIRGKLKSIKDARALIYAMNKAESEEAIARMDAAAVCNTAQREALFKWCEL
jgi:hypothetical protein